jgi:hypothetical protein
MHSSLKEASNSKPWLLGATFLYYTIVKFNQERNDGGRVRWSAHRLSAEGRLNRLLLQEDAALRDFCAGRSAHLASLARADFPRPTFPKTVSSTRAQYASMTFAFSADSPLVTCISGPNPESVAVRLTIM